MDSIGRLRKAVAWIDEENSKDPNIIIFKGKEYPKELLYSMQMTGWLLKMNPASSVELQLATRSQHICRWMSPRDSYSMDKVGYIRWRTELKNFHAEKAASIVSKCGFHLITIDKVRSLIRKEKLKEDPESQLLEDVVCLVFLENYFHDFSIKHDEDKVIDIVRKTWRKMSPKGREFAMKLELSEAVQAIVRKAIE